MNKNIKYKKLKFIDNYIKNLKDEKIKKYLK